jgi:hypothetical protein
MSQESGVNEAKSFTISVMFGTSGGAFTFTLDPTDENNANEVLNEILRLAKAPLIAEIEALKKRVLSVEEIQRFATLVKSHPNEMRFDGRPTSDDLLVAKLEAMLRT